MNSFRNTEARLFARSTTTRHTWCGDSESAALANSDATAVDGASCAPSPPFTPVTRYTLHGAISSSPVDGFFRTETRSYGSDRVRSGAGGGGTRNALLRRYLVQYFVTRLRSTCGRGVASVCDTAVLLRLHGLSIYFPSNTWSKPSPGCFRGGQTVPTDNTYTSSIYVDTCIYSIL